DCVAPGRGRPLGMYWPPCGGYGGWDMEASVSGGGAGMRAGPTPPSASVPLDGRCAAPGRCYRGGAPRTGGPERLWTDLSPAPLEIGKVERNRLNPVDVDPLEQG